MGTSHLWHLFCREGDIYDDVDCRTGKLSFVPQAKQFLQ